MILAGCGDDDELAPDAATFDAYSAPDAPLAPGATAIVEPVAPGSGAAWGSIPYPSDLLLDSDGRVTLTTLPTGPNPSPRAVTMLQEALHVLDGAGVTSHVYFPVEGNIDPATLAGNVHLIDLETAAEIPIELKFRADLASVIAAPRLGVILQEAHRYAAWMTDAVRAEEDRGVARTPAFEAALDLATVPADAGAAALQENLRPLLEHLGTDAASHLVSATVFTTQHVTDDMVKVRQVIAASPSSVHGPFAFSGPDAADLDYVFGGAQDPAAPPGYDDDNPRAQPHSNVALVLHGYITIPNFLSTEPYAAGFMEYDGDGLPVVKRQEEVRFTLVLPKATSYANLKTLLWIHGVNRARVDMLSLADPAAAQGYALFAIDLLFHGDRLLGPVDNRRDIIKALGADGFGDVQGLLPAINFFHLTDSGGVPAYHPRAMMENLRQSSADLIAITSFLTHGDPAPINTELAGLGLPSDLSFDPRIGILTESFGCIMAIVSAAVEPGIKIAFLASPANSFPEPLLISSANYSSIFADALFGPLDVSSRTVLGDPDKDARWEPVAMLYNGVIERGDATPYAPYLADGGLRGDDGINYLVTETYQDEWVPNSAVEHLAGVMGLPSMEIGRTMEPPCDPALHPFCPFRFVDLPVVTGPVEGNMNGGLRTAVHSLWYPAAHALTRKYMDYYDYEPEFPPFVKRATRWDFPNPILEVHRFWSTFFNAYYDGDESPPVSDPFVAP